jgi:hypothetical protein
MLCNNPSIRKKREMEGQRKKHKKTRINRKNICSKANEIVLFIEDGNFLFAYFKEL